MIDQGLNHVEHFGDVVGGFWLFGGRGDVQFPHVFVKRYGIFVGDLLPVHAFFISTVDDLVVDIGEVADEANFVAEVLEITVKGVEDNRGASVTDMAIVVNGNTADVHTDLFFF